MINVIMVLDESGSMDHQREQTLRGLNDYIKELQSSKEDMYLTLYTFNSYHNAKRRCGPIKKIDALTVKEYEPAGMTPLYDALGSILPLCVDSNSPDHEHRTICVIITDGLENDSRRWTRDKINESIGHLREHHAWDFVYLGANQDAWAAGRSIGVHKHDTVSYRTHEILPVFHSLAGATLSYAASVSTGGDRKFLEGWDTNLVPGEDETTPAK